MTRDVTCRWIEAGKLLADNPGVLVACPECGNANLCVVDHRSQDAPAVVERELRCPSCGARNFLRLLRPIDSSTTLGL